ncbi:ATP phosphoribosyltransferase, partial [candidate division NPL-UPA2 bacterium]|nr:ATP phosphoribosyltransferase [candidate division NPL-UPA2 bacterium]
KMNIPQEKLKKVISILPAMKTPTISKLSEENWWALETIIDEKTVRDIIPALKKAGAQGIIEYPLNKVIY